MINLAVYWAISGILFKVFAIATGQPAWYQIIEGSASTVVMQDVDNASNWFETWHFSTGSNYANEIQDDYSGAICILKKPLDWGVSLSVGAPNHQQLEATCGDTEEWGWNTFTLKAFYPTFQTHGMTFKSVALVHQDQWWSAPYAHEAHMDLWFAPGMGFIGADFQNGYGPAMISKYSYLQE